MSCIPLSDEQIIEGIKEDKRNEGRIILIIWGVIMGFFFGPLIFYTILLFFIKGGNIIWKNVKIPHLFDCNFGESKKDEFNRKVATLKENKNFKFFSFVLVGGGFLAMLISGSLMITTPDLFINKEEISKTIQEIRRREQNDECFLTWNDTK